MIFANWIQLKENVTEPDAKLISYTACVLHKTSQDELLAQAEQMLLEAEGIGLRGRGWLLKAHHMTVLPPAPSQTDISAAMPYFGQEVSLSITDWAVDEFCFAVVVRSSMPVRNAVPHITVAHSPDVGAKYSNTLLLGGGRVNWRRLHKEITLESFYLAIGRNGLNTYPEMSGILAKVF